VSRESVVRVGDTDCTLSALRLAHIETLIARQLALDGSLHDQLDFALTTIQLSVGIRHPAITVEALRIALDVPTTLAAFHKVMAISRADFDAITAQAVKNRRRQVGRISHKPGRGRR
jgi:hypothetical protein